jgi:hypothetical protein
MFVIAGVVCQVIVRWASAILKWSLVKWGEILRDGFILFRVVSNVVSI